MAERIGIELVIDDQGTAQIKEFSKTATAEINRLGQRVTQRLGGAFSGVYSVIKSVSRQLFSLKGAIAGIGIGLLAKSTLNVASSFEQMRIQLDTITGGNGLTTLNELNLWAMKMPINTQKAVQAFQQMAAMGLKPTIDQMTVLVDTTMALGGQSDTMLGISRALGQIATKGKLMSQEMLQLAERGVPIFDIIREAFGDVEVSTISADKAIAAIFAGLDQKFGGMSKKAQETWSGLWTTIKSYVEQFQKFFMESGVFDELKLAAGDIASMLEEAFYSGKMEKWANDAGKAFRTFLKGAKGEIGDFFKYWLDKWQWWVDQIMFITAPLRWLWDLSGFVENAVNRVASADVSKRADQPPAPKFSYLDPLGVGSGANQAPADPGTGNFLAPPVAVSQNFYLNQNYTNKEIRDQVAKKLAEITGRE